jgi:hypothetical protein
MNSILFYLSLDNEMSKHMRSEQKAFTIITEAILAATDPTDDFKALAASTPDANDTRRLVAQLIKILFNLSMEKDDPTIDTQLTPELYAAYVPPLSPLRHPVASTEMRFNHSISSRLVAILGQGVTDAEGNTLCLRHKMMIGR